LSYHYRQYFNWPDLQVYILAFVLPQKIFHQLPAFVDAFFRFR